MIDTESAHRRGDKSSATGFAYESLWRAYLMLESDPSDVLSIYMNEDLKVESATGKIVYFQIKQTVEWWNPSSLSDFLNRVRDGLSADPNVSFEFCTNAPLSKELREQFNDINDTFGKRLGFRQLLPADTHKLWSKIRALIETHFEPRQVINAVPLSAIDDCLARLFKLEAEFKSGADNVIRGADIRDRIGLTDLIESVPRLVAGKGLFNWEEWLETVRSNATDPASIAARRVVFEHAAIERDIEREILSTVRTWPLQRSQSFVGLIEGVSGTGKTWLLLRLGMELSKDFSVYWADELLDPDLAIVDLASYEDKPLVVLIDNVFESDWKEVLAPALRSQPPLFILATSSRSVYHEDAIDLRRRAGRRLKTWKLQPLIKAVPGELDLLVQQIRHEDLMSNQERRRLGAANIRNAERILLNRTVPTDLVDRLLQMWRRSDTQGWVRPFVLCSSLFVKIPRSILRSVARADPRAAAEFPDDLSPLTLASASGPNQLLWLEEPDCAAEVLRIIAAESETLEKELAEEVFKLINRVNHESPVDRRFARLLLPRFGNYHPRYRPVLLKSCSKIISNILERENAFGLAYVWLSFLTSANRPDEAQKAAQRFASQLQDRGPQTLSELMVFIQAFSNERAKQLLLKEMKSGVRWSVRPWALFLSKLHKLDRESRVELVPPAVRILQAAPLDLQELLDTQDTAVQLLSLVEDVGSAQAREWMLDTIHQYLDNRDVSSRANVQHLIPLYLVLTERCLMQPRNYLSINLVSRLMDGPAVHLPTLLGEAYDGYKRCYTFESEECRSQKALALALDYALIEQRVTKGNFLWASVLDFSASWVDQQRMTELLTQVGEFLNLNLSQGLPSRLYETSVIKYARTLVRKGTYSLESLRVLMEATKNTTPQVFGQMVVLMAAISARWSALENGAGVDKELLLSLVLRDKAAAKDLVEKFFSEIGGLTSKDSYLETDQTTHVLEFPQPVMIELLAALLSFIDWSDSQKRIVVSGVEKYWQVVRTEFTNPKAATSMGQRCIAALLKFGAPAESREILDDLISRSPADPDLLLLCCRWEAAYGQIDKAQKHFIASGINPGKNKKRGHPAMVARALQSMALRHEDQRREILILCSALTHSGPLMAIDELLQLYVPVSNSTPG